MENPKKQLMPKLLFCVSILELHSIMLITPEEVGPKEANYTENNIIIIDSTLRYLFPPQLKNTTPLLKSYVVASVAHILRACIHHYYHVLSVI